jgi:uncharacterized membrane protein YeaQ/YmgE (transglycosylase-associated protein family)
MEFGSVLSMLVIGALAGWLAGRVMEGSGFGLFGNIIVGVLGAVVAGFVFPALGFAIGGGFLASILHATIGAVIFLFVVSLLRPR